MIIQHFANVHLLWLLVIIPPMVAYYVYRNRQGGASIKISSVEGVKLIKKGVRHRLRHLPFVLRCVAMALLIVALARPQNSESHSNSKTEGIDIMLSLDISGSMLARDFDPDRMTAAKSVAKDFILDRPNDRIGLVVFAGESFTQSPLTTDKATLINLLSEVKSGVIDDGTAIGNGLATAVNRIKDSPTKSKVIILLTDGVNNSGQISPQTAADIAHAYGIKVYTIGVGSEGVAPYPAIDAWGNMTYTQMKVEIDEKGLTEIAELTGGRYFRATDNEKLKEIYNEINQLETSTIETENFTQYNELFLIFTAIALAFLLLEFICRWVYLRQIP